MAIVLFQVRDEGSHIAIHMRAFAQACPVNQRKGRLFERRPTFAQEVALCLDEYSLYLGARLFCHERESALESVYGRLTRASALREYQQLMAGAQFPRR